MTEQEWLACDDPHKMLLALEVGDLTGAYLTINGRRSSFKTFTRHPSCTDRKLILLNEVWLSKACGDERYTIGCLRDGTPLGECRATETNITRNYKKTAAAILRDVVGNPFRSAGFVRPGDKLKMLTEPTYRLVPAKEGDRVAATVVRVEGDKMRVQPAFGGSQGVWSLWRPDWLTPRVLSLAEAAYAERATTRCGRCGGRGYIYPHMVPANLKEVCPYCGDRNSGVCGTGTILDGTLDNDRLAILSDALEEAGCDNYELLSHLRGGNVQEYSDNAVAYFYTDISGSQLTPDLARAAHKHYRGCWALDLVLGRF